MAENKLSVVISAFNEEKKIEQCLKSVSFADEVIVVDNSSTDKTREIAEKYATHVFTRPNNLMLNVNKNYGFSKASHPWILNLDADEEVTEELREEVLETLSHPDDNGYNIPRKNIIFNIWIKHAGWYPDYQLRLFKKEKGKFPEKHVHEMIEVNGSIGELTHPMIHHNFESVSQFIYKHAVIYAPNEADDLMAKGYTFHYLDLIRFPFREFISRFFAREGYKDNIHGLGLSLLMAFYHLMIILYIWEKEGFHETAHPAMLQHVEQELKRQGKDMKYWFANEKVKNEKNIIHRYKQRLIRKIHSS